jgi:hypothetical protein
VETGFFDCSASEESRGFPELLHYLKPEGSAYVRSLSRRLGTTCTLAVIDATENGSPYTGPFL